MSRNGFFNFLVFIFLAAGATFGWWYVNKVFFPPPPPPPPPPEPPPELVMQALVGGLGTHPARFEVTPPKPPVSREVIVAAVGPIALEPRLLSPPPPAPKPKLIALGTEKSFLKVLLNTQGGSVQQVILPRFDEANRLGIRAKENGNTIPLHLIPGVVRTRTPTLLETIPIPKLEPGTVEDPTILSEPSYLLTHYPQSDDPKNPEHPVDELAVKMWNVVEQTQTADESRVVFETEIGAPYFLKIRKIYSLKPGEYHLGFKLTFEALKERPTGKDAVKFRYQLSGANDLPIEGEWYTGTYHNAIVGWKTTSGTQRRLIEDSLTIQTAHGGTLQKAEGNTFSYAAVANQYFASALAIDDTQADDQRKGMWAYVRPTRELLPWQPALRDERGMVRNSCFTSGIEDKAFLGGITVRVAATAIDPQPNQPIQHDYLIYNGPLKVRLLGQLKDSEGNKEVAPELVERYVEKLSLQTLTDHHSPHFFGRLSNSLWIADVIIFFTNVMHDVLGWLHGIVPIWGVNILMLTLLVRLLLLIPSKKQQGMMARMQEKMAKLKPEIDKLKEKCGDDYALFNQEKTRLMFRNGINPISQMGGCFLMFLQFPVFMGLYFCLQESIFFRLESFLWMPNLAAPDMLFWWGERIPFVSDPNSLGSTIYLGPYLNILPIAAIALMMIQQQVSMPPPTDDQQAFQAKMMKFMMIFMCVMFYKMAAGMCIYFIASTSWALIERRFVKKAMHIGEEGKQEEVLPSGGVLVTKPATPAKVSGPVTPEEPKGFFAKLRAKIEEVQRQAETQRQIRNDQSPPQLGQSPKKPDTPGGGGSGNNGGKGGKKKRKK